MRGSAIQASGKHAKSKIMSYKVKSRCIFFATDELNVSFLTGYRSQERKQKEIKNK